MSGDQPDDPSPWASDAIPVESEPVDIVWNRDVSNPQPDVDAHAGHGRPWWTRSWSIVAMAAAAVLLVAVVVWPRGGDDRAGDDPATSDPATANPATSEPAVADGDPTTTLDSLPAVAGDDATPDTTGVGGSQPAGTEIGPIELPDAVAAIEQPTELVMQTDTGLIHTLSLPSGTVRTVEVPETSANGGGFGSSIIASPSAAFVPGFDGDSYIVPRSGQAIVVDNSQFSPDDSSNSPQVSPLGWLRRPDGDVFLVSAYDPDGGDQRSYTIDSNGTATPTTIDFADGYSTAFATGQQIVNDAGGAYRIDADGTATRISAGQVIGSSADRLLVRECDEVRFCRYVVERIDGTEPRVVQLPEASDVYRYYGLALSPDGTAAAYTDYDETVTRIVVDLASGDTISSAQFGDAGPSPTGWAPDSSGEFMSATGNGLNFVDRASGESFEFGDELGQIAAIDVRYPDTELLEETPVVADEVGFSTTPAGEVGLDLVTVGRIGGMTLIDLDDATSTSWNTPSVPGNPPPQLFADDERVLAVAGNGNRGFVSEFGSVTELEAGAAPQAPRFPGPRTGLVWARDPAGTSEIDQTTLNLNGARPSSDVRTLMIADGALLGGDSTGGMVFESGGDVYVTAGGDAGGFTDGVSRLTTGELLAMGATTALVRECDDDRNCSVSIVERASGERTTVGISGPPNADGREPGDGFPLIGSMSPDGGLVVADFTSRDGEGRAVEKWFMFDLTTGNPTGIPAPEENQPIIWNSDASYAAFVVDGHVHLYERATYAVIEVDAASTDVRALAVAPAAFIAAAAR